MVTESSVVYNFTKFCRNWENDLCISIRFCSGRF